MKACRPRLLGAKPDSPVHSAKTAEYLEEMDAVLDPAGEVAAQLPIGEPGLLTFDLPCRP